MKYNKMIKFLNDNGICAIQPVIAHEVACQLDEAISEEEFENICENVYDVYLSSLDGADIWKLVNDELTIREYKL